MARDPALWRDRATTEPDEDVLTAAVQALAANWGDDPDTVPLLRDRGAPYWSALRLNWSEALCARY